MSQTTGRVGLKQTLKNTVYTAVGGASYYSGISWLRRAADGSSPRLRVLMYHKVNDLPGNTITVPPGLFRSQLEAVKAQYTVITPARLLEVIQGKADLPANAALITFDDGYRDNLDNAYPILKSLGLTAILFVPTDFIGADRLLPHDETLGLPNPTLGWEHLRQMQDVFTIASHGKSHRVMTRIPFDEAADEIHTSKTLIEQKLGASVDFFSYPKGSLEDVSPGLEYQVQQAGYAASFGTIPASNPLAVVRDGSLLRRYNAEPFGGFTFDRLLDGSCDLIGIKDTALGASGKRFFNRILGTTTR